MKIDKETNLRPCPFCGVIPILYWEDWKDISSESGCYHIEADHRKECYILHINGMNSTGRISSFNKKCLIDWWNRRYDTEEDDGR